MSAQGPSGGFADAPVDAAWAFRAVLDALSRPGRIVDVTGALPPAPLSVAAGVALLTLCDGTTPLHLAGAHDTDDMRRWIAFHTAAPLVGTEAAVFAIGTWDALSPVSRFATGTVEYPDCSATLIVEVPALTSEGPRLTGPGIQSAERLFLPETAAFRANRALFPRGFDAILTCGTRLAGLPRSTVVEDA